MTKELLIKFLNDHCTDEELKQVVQWIKEDSLSSGSKEWGYGEWESIEYQENENLPDDETFQSLLDRVHHKINIANYNKPYKPAVLFTTWLTRAAAILLVPVLAFLIYTLSQVPANNSQYSDLTIDSLEIVAPTGSKTFIQFSDGSEVFLNHGSKLKYPQKFTGNTREVILTGEGYFKISHNPEKPFIVKTKNLDIKALGTTFNVHAYPDENIVATTLIEGKVMLERKTYSQRKQTIGAMVPGQHVSYKPGTGEVFSSKGDIEKYISWKDGKLIFKRDSLVQIADRLSRWYSVDIEITDEAAKEFTYTATFVDEPLFHILALLKDAAPIDYRQIPRKQLPDGTFSKQKIIIEKRN
ncbi:DUF4974 domain-containing protein [Mariniphaga sediminis]|jgi:ferric-dicitrate binding protein FerR (iron transport regulator)|uniref:DUF4974 domain-containing protein n=1 Tax=Mariniphaga sediminis TaxID=1628158 RepID=A0A399CY96_9BACT|nr:FecR domain-containing protein [Mariniphaga sediminis]RIH64297.1 DUF4974 domain-containing protein [Mariniphaga sediminis]RIH66576.1 DUF4974 domain-containing protein [Mariniphaga sediminis]